MCYVYVSYVRWTVTCHVSMSHVMCRVSHVMSHISKKNCGASRLRVFYRRGPLSSFWEYTRTILTRQHSKFQFQDYNCVTNYSQSESGWSLHPACWYMTCWAGLNWAALRNTGHSVTRLQIGAIVTHTLVQTRAVAGALLQIVELGLNFLLPESLKRSHAVKASKLNLWQRRPPSKTLRIRKYL